MAMIKGIASLGAAMLIGVSVTPVQAGYVVDLTEQGGNVVATGSGAIDLTGLVIVVNTSGMAFLHPALGAIRTGPPPFTPIDGYGAVTGFTGPTNFGSGSDIVASSGSGDPVGFFFGFSVSDNELDVPSGYVSNSALSDISIYNGQTFSSLGATPGRYEWTWGTGANQNFTLVIGTVVPEPSTWAMMLLGFVGLGFVGYQSAGPRRAACNV
jgi:PEP-CTERM motif